MNNATTEAALNKAALPQDYAAAATRIKCQAVLATLAQRKPALIFASLSTVDGRSYASAHGRGEFSPQRIAAITSSLLALSESFAKEAAQGRCSYAAVSTDHGSIVIVRVPSKKRQHALSICADLSDNMAMSLRTTLDAAETLAQILDQAD